MNENVGLWLVVTVVVGMFFGLLLAGIIVVHGDLGPLEARPHAVIVTLANHEKVNCVQAGPSVDCDWLGAAGKP